MANVVRVIKNSNYTTLSNYHFKDKRLSWKAKGLLSTMLSLPDNWNYTIEGLAALAGDGIKSTNSGLAELEKNGYLLRKQLRDENGHFAMTEYTIFEEPVIEVTKEPKISDKKEEKDVPLCQNGQTAENTAFQPLCQKRQTEKRFAEKGVLLNTNILNTNILKSSSTENENQDQEEENDDHNLWERLQMENLKRDYPALAVLFYEEVKIREPDVRALISSELLRALCAAIAARQSQEPIRMLRNFISRCLDNAICGIKVCNENRAIPLKNGFKDFEQRDYNFAELEKELLAR